MEMVAVMDAAVEAVEAGFVMLAAAVVRMVMTAADSVVAGREVLCNTLVPRVHPRGDLVGSSPRAHTGGPGYATLRVRAESGGVLCPAHAAGPRRW